MKLKEVGSLQYENMSGFYWLDLLALTFKDINHNKHRTDGPALIYSSGYKQWWVHGKFIKANLNET